MLFHTYLFIFGFLPATLIAFFVAAKINRKLPVFVLIAASIVFYAYWMPAVTLLLLGSIVFNYLAGRYLQSDKPKAQRRLAIAGFYAGAVALTALAFAAADASLFAFVGLGAFAVHLGAQAVLLDPDDGARCLRLWP